MSRLVRFSISMERELLRRLDAHLKRVGYANRSEAIRDFARGILAEKELEDPKVDALAAVSIVYDHHRLELPERLTELQHRHHQVIVSTLHIHIDRHNCLEVVVLRGKAGMLRKIGDSLIGMNGVKYGKMLLTVPSKLS